MLLEALQASCLHAEVITTGSIDDEATHQDLIFLRGVPSWPDSHSEDVRTDRLLRAELDRRSLPYQVLCGSAEECLAQSLQIIQNKLAGQTSAQRDGRSAPLQNPPQKARPWVWSCEKCSDPQCEHLLLSSLLTNRKAAATEQLP